MQFYEKLEVPPRKKLLREGKVLYSFKGICFQDSFQGYFEPTSVNLLDAFCGYK